MVTIKDVAKEAGVAISTVSNVLNNIDGVSEATREKVIGAAKKLKYIPNLNARLLKVSKTFNIGVFIPDVQGSFYIPFIQYIYRHVKSYGYSLNIMVDENIESDKLCMKILSSGVDGAIVLHHRLKDEDMEIFNGMLPVVCLDREVSADNISSIVINNEQGIVAAMEYLIMTGHKRIGAFRGIPNYDSIKRYAAYEAVMHKYGLEIDPAIDLVAHYDEASAYNKIREIIATGVELPDAMMCFNDNMAIGCIKALKDVGVSVPEQVSVVGFDDIEICEYFSPQITSVRVRVAELCGSAVDELMRLINKEKKGSVSFVDAKLVVRDSCKLQINASV